MENEKRLERMREDIDDIFIKHEATEVEALTVLSALLSIGLAQSDIPEKDIVSYGKVFAETTLAARKVLEKEEKAP